jgi:hypothetical protein
MNQPVNVKIPHRQNHGKNELYRKATNSRTAKFKNLSSAQAPAVNKKYDLEILGRNSSLNFH